MGKIVNLFSWLEEISFKKSDPDSFSEQDWVSFDPYMIHRFISMKPEYLELVNYIQTIPSEFKKQIYTVYLESIPKRKTWFKYMKKPKEKYNKDLIQHISTYFKCSLKESLQYLGILEDDSIRSILKGMGKDDKEISKLLKGH